VSGADRGQAWSGERAESHLRSLELFGMRFGLDRMRRMMTVLGSPERRFRSIHVVGTNGKSSTTRMTAAILERHGLSTGAYLSPHLVSYTERVQIRERDIPMHTFAAAVARAAWAAERVNRTLAEDDHVTQFELLTAAAFWALAEHGVEVAVVEAGLGGRYDATAVIESTVTALTSVGLEHTRWLGPTVRDIAAEKLAVLRPHTTLALGVALDGDALELARTVAEERESRIVMATLGSEAESGSALASVSASRPHSDEVARAEGGAVEPPRALGVFQRRNFALARAAAEAYLRSVGVAPREDAIHEAAATTAVPGRLEVIAREPLTIVDGAHNPDAITALVEALPELIGVAPHARALGLVMGVLEDKDAASMLRQLLPLCSRAWFTAPPSARALSPAALQSLARQLGFAEVLCESQPRRALAHAQAWAREQPTAAVLVTGSVYLVGDILADEAHERSADAAGESLEHPRRQSEGGAARGSR
jgi:dihydrofolate synthase/folylpolyglutamate synthase